MTSLVLVGCNEPFRPARGFGGTWQVDRANGWLTLYPSSGRQDGPSWFWFSCDPADRTLYFELLAWRKSWDPDPSKPLAEEEPMTLSSGRRSATYQAAARDPVDDGSAYFAADIAASDPVLVEFRRTGKLRVHAIEPSIDLAVSRRDRSVISSYFSECAGELAKSQ